MNKPSRRAVVRTGVWAVPVITTAAAAPAFAGTGTPPVVITGIASACKMPGSPRGKSYAVMLNVSNTGAGATNLSIDSIVVTITKGQQTSNVGYCPSTFAIPVGDSEITVFLSDFVTSQNKDAVVDINYTSPANSGTQTLEFTVAGFHPFGDCPKDLQPPASC